MSPMAAQVTVISGGGASASRPRSQLWIAYEQYKLERQGDLVSEKTLETYQTHVEPFLTWVADENGVRRFADLDIGTVRAYRAREATRKGSHGRPLSPFTVLDSHKSLLTFLRWAKAEGYEFDPRILELKRPRVPKPEADVYHVSQLKEVLKACNREMPQEELAVRILVGSGVRASELCGLALVGPDGLSDVMTDSLARGRVELRVRWDAGAKGRKSRRVPITAKLAAGIKAYEGRHRPHDTSFGELLINHHGRPYRRYGIDAIMDRLQRRVKFRVHAHAFRHTFATVATKLGWNFEHLRAAMGHAEYKELQRYVRLATERDLGSRKDWLEFIVANPATDWV